MAEQLTKNSSKHRGNGKTRRRTPHRALDSFRRKGGRQRNTASAFSLHAGITNLDSPA